MWKGLLSLSGTFDIQDLIVSECPGGGCISVSIEYALPELLSV